MSTNLSLQAPLVRASAKFTDLSSQIPFAGAKFTDLHLQIPPYRHVAKNTFIYFFFQYRLVNGTICEKILIIAGCNNAKRSL